MVKGVIFDLDGTLLDSMWVWRQVDTRFLLNHGLPVEEEYLEALKTMNFSQCAAYTKERYGIPMSDAEMMAEWDSLAKEAYAKEVGAKDGAIDFLRYLKGKGIPLSVATSSYQGLFTPTLRRLGIDGIFDAITTKDEVSCGKEKPDIYLLAAEKIGAKASECAVFEDILPAVKTCKSAGFYTVGVRDNASLGEEALIRRYADLYITDFNAPILKEIF